MEKLETSFFIEQTTWLHRNYFKMLKRITGVMVKQIIISQNFFICKTSLKNVTYALLFFKQHSLTRYKQLIDIAAEDYWTQFNKFRINYLLLSLLYNARIIISLTANELEYLPSNTKIFCSSNWLEREVWDMYGIFFQGNTDLRRILTDYGFSGHPLRKNFPLTGFSEIYYSLQQKKILSKRINLSTPYRVFSL